MATISDSSLRETSVLIRAFELVIRKLIRLMIGMISLRKIQEMIQIIFIEEAEARLKKKNPEQSVALADLAMLADLDTRSIKKIRSYIALSAPLHKDRTFLSELIPETSVLDYWQSNSRYQDEKTGQPKTLKIRGTGSSFESLLKESTSTNGVSVDSFIQRLVESNSIEITADGKEVRLIDAQYTPFALTDTTTSLKVGLAVVSNLLDTVTHNLRAPARGDGAFYQRGCWTTRLSKQDRDKLREMTCKFLLRSDMKARKLIGKYERNLASNEQITAGVSMFYFEEDKAA